MPFWGDVKIVAGERVTVIAMSLPAVLVFEASPLILGACHWLHMIGVDAMPNAAKMVDLKTIWNAIPEPFIGPAVSKDFLPTVISEFCIPFVM